MKIFKSAALLCAVSFTPSQASDCGNPYGINQERERNNRFIRVITEIPVGMLDSDVSHHGRCEYAGLPSASEGCPSKKAGTQSLIESLLASSGSKCSTETPFAASVLQLLIELTKNLKVASAGDSENGPTFGFGGRPGVAEANAAKIKAINDAKYAWDAAKKADDAKKIAENYYESEIRRNAPNLAKTEATMRIKAREAEVARINAEKLGGIAEAASVKLENIKAAELVNADEPPLVYKDDRTTESRGRGAESYFVGLEGYKKVGNLHDAANGVIDLYRANPSITNVEIAYNVLKALRLKGARYEDIRNYWSGIWSGHWDEPWFKEPKTIEIKDIALMAIRSSVD